jgi:phosphoglycerate dehydrogenase-like enzyme
MVIVIDAPLPEPQAERIRKLSPDIELRILLPWGGPIAKDVLRDAEVIYTAAADFSPGAAPRLRFVQTNSAAINPIHGKPILSSSIPICNVAGAYTAAVSECAIGMLLAVTRRIPTGVRFQSQGRWPQEYDEWCGTDLYGKTMGIVGYGSIGRHIARIAQAMGMTVLACKRNPRQRRDHSFLLPGTGDPEGRIPKSWFGPDRIPEMFRESDVAMLALPHAPTTERLIGRKEISALPRHAVFANVGRGAVVDEEALVEALQSGAIAGAALDVFVNEPLPADSPLWKMPNVLIMPHVASWTDMQTTHAAEVLVENLSRTLQGQPLVNVIDRKLLY